MARHIVQVFLDSFWTKTSGDVGGGGEFYFKTNGRRYPDEGTINLKAGQTFVPDPKPTFYTALTEDKNLKLSFQVFEEDPGLDDKFLDEDINHPIRPGTQTLVLQDKKGKVKLILIVKIEEANRW